MATTLAAELGTGICGAPVIGGLVGAAGAAVGGEPPAREQPATMVARMIKADALWAWLEIGAPF